MRIFPSAFALKRKNRVEAAAAFREERIVRSTAWTILVPAFTAYAGVDWIASGFQRFWIYLFLRFAVIVLAVFLYSALRGRVKHSLRFLLIPALPTFLIQLLMISNQVYFSPYFAGVALILFQGLIHSPKSVKWTAVIFTLSCSPSFYIFIKHFSDDRVNSLLGLTMLIGTIGTCLTYTERVRGYLFDAFTAQKNLADDLRNRDQEVREKAAELIKRKKFESQFSPQIISDVLGNLSRYEKLSPQKISVMVCDIVGSTQKANALQPEVYSEVIEEVFDVISAGCLRWDITIDKFTGDGAQAFSGSPKSHPDDLSRATKACAEILGLLQSRKDYLELRWGDPVQLRFGICEGESLVGFLGKGSMKSFTAIGANVSLAHRLCAEAKPNHVIAYSLTDNTALFDLLPGDLFQKKTREISRMKGFEDLVFKTTELTLKDHSRESLNLGRCETCSTPLVLLENKSGIPKLVCPSCNLSETAKADLRIVPPAAIKKI
ncbi:MAG: adenylate cyclase [Bacteriovoracaceae bacterium]|nr:adenylate cyclase [Bacteriovoracaceae bacterium]